MNDRAKPAARPWRRFLRFSVRGMIFLVVVIGGWLGWIVRSARIQRDAVDAITKADGQVTYDWHWTGTDRKVAPTGRPWAPRWVVDLVGVDYFGNIRCVLFYSPSKATGATIAQVGRLSQLQELHLDESSLDDASMVHLKGLTELYWFSLSDTPVTGAGLAQLTHIHNSLACCHCLAPHRRTAWNRLRRIARVDAPNFHASVQARSMSRRGLRPGQSHAALPLRLRVSPSFVLLARPKNKSCVCACPPR